MNFVIYVCQKEKKIVLYWSNLDQFCFEHPRNSCFSKVHIWKSTWVRFHVLACMGSCSPPMQQHRPFIGLDGEAGCQDSRGDPDSGIGGRDKVRWLAQERTWVDSWISTRYGVTAATKSASASASTDATRSSHRADQRRPQVGNTISTAHICNLYWTSLNIFFIKLCSSCW